MGFAGSSDCWRDRTYGEEILSCTIIVCDANEWMERNDRLPLILVEEKCLYGWLNGSTGPEALTCAAESVLREWPVSPRFNRRRRRR
jgi:putative SOS response-associated peptidase YedK